MQRSKGSVLFPCQGIILKLHDRLDGYIQQFYCESCDIIPNLLRLAIEIFLDNVDMSNLISTYIDSTPYIFFRMVSIIGPLATIWAGS